MSRQVKIRRLHLSLAKCAARNPKVGADAKTCKLFLRPSLFVRLTDRRPTVCERRTSAPTLFTFFFFFLFNSTLDLTRRDLATVLTHRKSRIMSMSTQAGESNALIDRIYRFKCAAREQEPRRLACEIRPLRPSLSLSLSPSPSLRPQHAFFPCNGRIPRPPFEDGV